jgi:hypothetical protein
MSRGRLSVLLSFALLGQFVVPPVSARLADESTIAGVEQLDGGEFLTGGAVAAELVKVLEIRQMLPVPGMSPFRAKAERRLPRWPRPASAAQRAGDHALCNLYLRLTRSDPGEAPH